MNRKNTIQFKTLKASKTDFLQLLIDQNKNNKMKQKVGNYKIIGFVGERSSGKKTLANFAADNLNFNVIIIDDIFKIIGYIYFEIFLAIYKGENFFPSEFIYKNEYIEFIKHINYYCIANKIYIFNNESFDLNAPKIIKCGQLFKKWKNEIDYANLIKNFLSDNHLIVINYKSFNYTFHIKRSFKKRLMAYDKSEKSLRIEDLHFKKLLLKFPKSEIISFSNNLPLNRIKKILYLYLD